MFEIITIISLISLFIGFLVLEDKFQKMNNEQKQLKRKISSLDFKLNSLSIQQNLHEIHHSLAEIRVSNEHSINEYNLKRKS